MTKEWLDRVAQTALCYRETLEATYDIACSLIRRGIPGDFVECGVFAGAHCAVMAQAIMDAPDTWVFDEAGAKNWPVDVHRKADKIPRRVHLFDSFTGIPQAGPNDIEFLEAGKKPGESTCSRAQVEAYMKEWGIPSELLVYHEGLFAHTITEVLFARAADLVLHRTPSLESIAFLRLDGDLYESTRVCLDLLPLVSRGGWVCVDDFNLSGCRQALLERVVPAPIYWRVPKK